MDRRRDEWQQSLNDIFFYCFVILVFEWKKFVWKKILGLFNVYFIYYRLRYSNKIILIFT